MEELKSATKQIIHGEELYHPGFSVDCVIIGFHAGLLKILLNKFDEHCNWMLPGGFVLKEENVDRAAYRILQHRTGLKRIFLQQFHLFGNAERSNAEVNKLHIDKNKLDPCENQWLLQRFITVGYYALVDFSKVNIGSSDADDCAAWFDINDIPSLYADHNEIIEKALQTIRLRLSILPIGYELLPDKFTIPELHVLYETLLGKELDRRNFQKKVLSFDFLKKLDEQRRGGAHKAPYLYRFDKKKYDEALENGVSITP